MPLVQIDPRLQSTRFPRAIPQVQSELRSIGNKMDRNVRFERKRVSARLDPGLLQRTPDLQRWFEKFFAIPPWVWRPIISKMPGSTAMPDGSEAKDADPDASSYVTL
jgi:hypothetical protein